MPGGLINIASYGSQDLYLTGTPEITFFRIVYRRHTNFAIDSIEVKFEDEIGFGLESRVILPRIADLVHRIYLQIDLPEIAFMRPDSIISSTAPNVVASQTALSNAQNDYNSIVTYMDKNIEAYRKALDSFIAVNTNLNDIIVATLTAFSGFVTTEFETTLVNTYIVVDIIYEDLYDLIIEKINRVTIINDLNLIIDKILEDKLDSIINKNIFWSKIDITQLTLKLITSIEQIKTNFNLDYTNTTFNYLNYDLMQSLRTYINTEKTNTIESDFLPYGVFRLEDVSIKSIANVYNEAITDVSNVYNAISEQAKITFGIVEINFNEMITVLNFIDLDTIVSTYIISDLIDKIQFRTALGTSIADIVNLFNTIYSEGLNNSAIKDALDSYILIEKNEALVTFIDPYKQTYIDSINIALEKSKEVQKYYYNYMYFKEQQNLDSKNRNYKFAWVRRLGHAIIDYIDIEIGGDTIDRQYGDWLNIWHELTSSNDIQDTYDKMIGDIPEMYTFDRTTKSKYRLYIPLQYWFCRHAGLALPLVALQYHDISITVKLRKMQDCGYIENYDGTPIFLDDLIENNNLPVDASLLIDYIYLDSPERKLFAQASHEYLIEQIELLDFVDINQEEVQIPINFNNPCKELIWVAQKKSFVSNTNGHIPSLWDNYTISEENKINPFLNVQFDVSGFTRIEKYEGSVFNYLQPYIGHTRIPIDGVNVYSFALKPEEHQPSGSFNFSRIEKPIFIFKIHPDMLKNNDVYTIRIYAINYNILRVMSGMAGLAYI
jgi:hypothetical protein